MRIAAAFIFVVFLAVVLKGSPVSRLNPETAEELAALTENRYEKSDIYSRAWLHQKSLDVLKADPEQPAEALWRQARAKIDLGEKLEGDSGLPLFEEAKLAAEQAIHHDPQSAMAYQALAVACGRVALFKGVFKSIGLVKTVHESALKAVALGDSMPIALYVLGRTHKKLLEKPGIVRKALGLGWAKEDSVGFYFEKAIEVSKGNMIQCFVEYGDFLIEKDVQKAELMLNKALALPLRDEQDQKAKQRASQLLIKLQK